MSRSIIKHRCEDADHTEGTRDLKEQNKQECSLSINKR
jgi:hypothetical protein